MKNIVKSLLVFLLLVAFVFGLIIPQAKAIYNVSLNADPNIAGRSATYRIAFIMQKALPANGSIFVTFPTSFTVPQTAPDKQNFSVNYTTPDSVAVNGNTLVIVPSQTNSLPAGYVLIDIAREANIVNPSAGGSYTITVSTSVANEPMSYGNLSIVSAVSNVSVAIDNYVAYTPATYIINFTPNIQLNPFSDYIYIDFPSGTTIPNSFANANIAIDGSNVSYTYISSPSQYRLQIRVPFTISAGNSHQIFIPSNFGILNSTIVGVPLKIKVSTSQEPAISESNPFTFTGTSISNLIISDGMPLASSRTSFVIQFDVSSQGALTSGVDYIRVEFPQGFYLPPYTPSTYIFVNSFACTTKTVNNNVLTIYIPTGVSVSNGQRVVVTILDSFGITNPSQPGMYNIKVSTNKDTIPVLSSVYIAGTSVSDLSISADPPVQGASAKYTVSFVTSSNSYLQRGVDSISIRFDPIFYIPLNIPNGSIVVNDVVCNDISVFSSEIVIKTPVSIGPNSRVTVVITADAGIFNPRDVDTARVFVHTSKDIVDVSASFRIVVSTISKPTLELSSYGVGEIVSLKISFNTGAGGALTLGSDTLTIILPTDFSVPVSIPESSVRVNGYAISYISRTGNRITIKTTISIPANSPVTITIDETANIKNPLNPGSYNVIAYTSRETTPVYSAPVKIVNLPKTTIVVSPVQPDGENGYYKTSPKVVLYATSSSDTNPLVYYYIDAGAQQLYTSPITIPDGTHTLYYYAKDKYGNTEHIQSKQFIVDTVAPVVTITSPKDGEIMNQKSVTINGRVSEMSSVTINGTSVNVKPDLTFSYTAPLTAKTIFVIVAKDIAGNIGQGQITVLLDITPPKLTVTKPLTFQNVTTPFVDVEGYTDADAVSVYVNGQKVMLSTNYTFAYRVPLTTDGLNIIEVKAVDSVGNESKFSVPVYYYSKTKIVLQVDNKIATINDKSVQLDAPPKIVNGNTLVPVRFIVTAFGAKVDWDPSLKIVSIKLSDISVMLQVDSKYASLNGQKITLSVAPKIINGYTYVPLRFISEAFDADVNWDSYTRTVTIIYPK